MTTRIDNLHLHVQRCEAAGQDDALICVDLRDLKALLELAKGDQGSPAWKAGVRWLTSEVGK